MANLIGDVIATGDNVYRGSSQSSASSTGSRSSVPPKEGLGENKEASGGDSEVPEVCLHILNSFIIYLQHDFLIFRLPPPNPRGNTNLQVLMEHQSITELAHLLDQMLIAW